MKSSTTAKRKQRLLYLGLAGVLVIASAAGCSPSSTANHSLGESDALNAECGVIPDVGPLDDPDGVVDTLPAAAQVAFNGFPFPVLPSAWTDYAPEDAPTIGFSSLPAYNSWGASFIATVEDQFQQASDAGLVSGELLTQIPADIATMTVADQVRGYQELVAQGADIILLYPLQGDAFTQAIDEAGEKGVVTITLHGNVPSKYAVNLGTNPYLVVAEQTAPALKVLNGKGNAIMVAGIEGLSVGSIQIDAFESLLAQCPDMKLTGTVYGGYADSSAKVALTSFLASHPEQIDLVYENGAMGAGVWSAFEELDRPFPILLDQAPSAASLAYWDREISNGYQGFGLAGSGSDDGALAWGILESIVAGKAPIVNNMPFDPSLILSNDNYTDLVVPGAGTDSTDEPLSADPRWYASPDWFQNFFAR